MGVCYAKSAPISPTLPVAALVCTEDIVCDETFCVLRHTVDMLCTPGWIGGDTHTIKSCAVMLAENRPVQLAKYARELASEKAEWPCRISGILVSALNEDYGECW